MKFLPQLLLLPLLLISCFSMADKSKVKKIEVIALYQIEDESDSGFDFFSSKKIHKCGGKASNRFRSFSDNENINERKFQLILSALNNEQPVNVRFEGCEGKAMLISTIGLIKK